jgi:hypothetical protein
MTTTKHISDVAFRALHPVDYRRALPAALAVGLMVASLLAWHAIIGIALSSVR